MAIDPAMVWHAFFTLFLIGFIFVMWMKKDPRFLFYFIFGSILGFALFDLPSIALGYYAYPAGVYPFPILGVPLTVSLAEGFCVAIVIYIHEFLKEKFTKRQKK
jgi:hypothetical protein